MLTKFLKDKDGSFAVWAAGAAMLLLLGFGVAVDINGVHSLRSNYQDMADAAVLSAAKSRPKEQSAMQLKAREVVNYLDNTGTPPGTTAILSADKKTLQVHLDGTFKTHFMGMFGASTVQVKVMAETLIEVPVHTDIVLVLDTTRSMNYQNRLIDLKAAATNFVNVIESVDTDKVRIAVVPFGQYVNVGLGVRNEDWISVPDDWYEPVPDTCTTSSPVIGQNCGMFPYPATPAQPYQPAVPATPATYGTCTDDGVSYSCQTSPGTPYRPAVPAQPAIPAGERYGCQNIYGSPVTTCTPNPPIPHLWHGCVGSRIGNWNLVPEYLPTHPNNSKVPGFLDLICGAEVMQLTTNLNSVKAKIASLTTNGETYAAPGLMWGWRMLEPRQPFSNTRPLPAGADVRRVAIFMSDGRNTKSRNGQLHDGTSRSNSDNVTIDTCDDMKDEGIEVHSIAFKVQDNQAKNLIRDCATHPENYYNANNASLLHSAFEGIALSLMSPRLTQ